MLLPPTTPDTTTTGSTAPVTTGTTQPPSGEISSFLSSQCLLYSSLLSGAAPVSAGVITGAVVAVVAIVLIILIVLLIVSFLKYHNKGTRTMCVVRVVLADTGS